MSVYHFGRFINRCRFIPMSLKPRVTPLRQIFPVLTQLSIPACSRSFCVTKQLTCDLKGDESSPEEHEELEQDPTKDRTKVVPVKTSIKYMESEAYKITYGNDAVWVKYRRNFKGQRAPKKTRRTCIRGGVISTGNPCPICRDEYLVLDYRNVKLLNQFIYEHNGQVIHFSKTNICQTRWKELLVAIDKAKDMGLISFDVPFREYNYQEYFLSGKLS